LSHHNSHSKWIYDLAIEIDRHCPGFLGEFFRASTEKRQVIAAYLSLNYPDQKNMAQIADFLLSCAHGAILRTGYGELPLGLRSALRRAGPSIHDLQFYMLLKDSLAKPPHPKIIKCIAGLPSLDLTKLLVVRILPEQICHPNVVGCMDTVEDANDTAVGFHLLAERGVDAQALAVAIKQVGNPTEMPKLWQRWVRKPHCDHPIPADATYRPVTSGEQLSKLSLRYRNCGSRYITQLIEGNDAFAEFEYRGEGGVVHLQKKQDQWRLEGLHGPRNAPPSSRLRNKVSEYLTKHGVEIVSRDRAKPTEFDCLRRLTMGNFFEFDFD